MIFIVVGKGKTLPKALNIQGSGQIKTAEMRQM
jgi:hypothetical protein